MIHRNNKRDLVTGITIRRGASTNVVLRNYTYDALGRPLTRSTARNGTTQNDAFGYNARSELTSATLGNDEYAYAFDNIGNRNTASETGAALAYSTNNLNQYASIGENEGNAFVPGYDADGNATSIQTSTGTWSVEYNGANRPVRFRNEESDTTIECGYDSQGRRCFKKVTVAGTVTLHHRYIYRGYLQIACVDLTRSGHPALWFVTWDPTQPTATRPLAIQKDGTWYTYGCDITKNVCEVFGPAGYIRTSYSYAPFGAVTASGNVTQPFQWSSEHYDSETALVYYNFRHYSPDLGRWLSRDPIEERGGLNLSAFVGNSLAHETDGLGLSCPECRRAVDAAWRRLAPYSKALEKMKNRNESSGKFFPQKCRVNKPTCKSDPDNGGNACFLPCESSDSFQRNAVGTITVFCGVEGESFETTESQIYHELFHTYQYCINELKKGSCEELLRTEIDAYCAQSNQYPVMHKRKFVKEGALASSVGGKCLEEDMSRLFDEIFDEKRCALLALPKALSGKE